MELITPDWQVPANIKAVSSTRIGGLSKGDYQGLNIGAHVGDDPVLVLQNRALLRQFATMPADPVWLNQTHSTDVVCLQQSTKQIPDADGSYTSSSGLVCCVMTADCLPVLMTDVEGSRVAAVHAGWRGLADGILEQAVKKFDKPVIAWLGPAIGRHAFEVGADVFDAFTKYDAQAADAFSAKSEGKYLADMNLLALQRLNSVGVEKVYCSELCTYADPTRFYSYRRDGVTGRQASFIWIED